MRRILLAASVAAIVVVGCGDGDGPSSTTSTTGSSTSSTAETTTTTRGAAPTATSDRDQVERAARIVVGGADPQQVCTRLVTRHFMRVAYGGPGACLQAQPHRVFPITQVSGTRVAGRTAQTVVEPASGPYAHEEVRVDLVKQGNDWKVDALRANVPVGP